MKYRLGLDMGTNSIGWAIINTENESTPTIVDAGVRIFTDGRMPAKGGPIGEPLAVQRRQARAMRRQRDRRKRRQKLVMNELIRSGFLPVDRSERKALLRMHSGQSARVEIPSRGLAERVFGAIFRILKQTAPSSRSAAEGIEPLNPYYLRHRALDHALTQYELGRVVMHLAIHRGFKSNRKADSADPDSGRQYEMIHQLRDELRNVGYRTLGEYLWERHKAGLPVRFRPGSVELYPDRSMYQDEFNEIRRVQSEFHPSLNWDRLQELIYYQRPLHPQERGRCTFYPDESRAFIDLPSVQRWRILQELRNLRYSDSHGQILPLTPGVDAQVYNLACHQKSVSFDKLRTIVSTDGKFNLESERRDKLDGNRIEVDLRKPEAFGPAWDDLPLDHKDQIVSAIYESETEELLFASLKAVANSLSDEQCQAIGKVTVRRQTASVSARFARACVELMEAEPITFDEAKRRLGFDSRELSASNDHDFLPYYGEILGMSTVNKDPTADPTKDEEKHFGRITNVTVHIALNQLRKVINGVIRKYGKPDEIVVELGRELKYGKSRIEEEARKQTKNQKDNERIRSELKDLGIHRSSREDLLKFKLWEELGTDDLARTCVYCGKTIALSELYNGTVEIEHILPRSRTLLNGRSNLTVAHKTCNNVKGNRTPYEAFADNPNGFNYQEILVRANRAFRSDPKKRKNFSAKALEDVPEVGEFLDRQLTDNAYIARATTQYLAAICDRTRIWPTNGRLTALARVEWGYDMLLVNPAVADKIRKNRTDHRHHALDAITVALTTRGMVRDVASITARNNEARYARRLKLPDAPISRDEVFDTLLTILPSVRATHSKAGKLFDETAMGSHAFPDIERHGETTGKVWGYRKPLSQLNEKEAREAIVDPVLRRAVSEWLDNHASMKIDKSLAAFSEETGVRRVRIVSRNQKPVKVGSAPYKAYAPSDVMCCVVWLIPGKKKPRYHGEFWSRTAVAAPDWHSGLERPHPAAKRLSVLYKNDILELTDSGGRRCFARVKGFSATANKLDLQPLHSASSVLDWVQSSNPEMANWTLNVPKSIQNHESINRVYSEFTVRKIIIDEVGDVVGR